MMEWRSTAGIGVLFSRWQRKRGMQESGSLIPSSPPPPSHRWGCVCVYETLRFQGLDEDAAVGEEKQGWGDEREEDKQQQLT